MAVRQKMTARSRDDQVAVRQKMTGRSRDDQVAVHLAVRDRNLILGANGHSVAVHSVRTRSIVNYGADIRIWSINKDIISLIKPVFMRLNSNLMI